MDPELHKLHIVHLTVLIEYILFGFVIQGVHREENCHSLRQLLLNRRWSSAWMFSCLQVFQSSSCSQAVSLHLLYAHISLPVSIKISHIVDVVVEIYT